MPDEQGCRQVGVTGQGSRLEFLARNLAQQMPLKTDGSVEEALSWQPYHYAETIAQKIRSSTFGPEASCFPFHRMAICYVGNRYSKL